MARKPLSLSLPSDADQWPAPGSPQEDLDLEQRLFLIDYDIAKLRRSMAIIAGLLAASVLLNSMLWALLS